MKLIPAEYDPIVVWIIIAISIPFITKFINWMLSPNYKILRSSKTIYECGETPIGEAQRRYNFQFFAFAIVFVLFDVLSVFLLSFALVFRHPDVDMIQILAIITGFTLLPIIGLVFWLIKNELLWS